MDLAETLRGELVKHLPLPEALVLPGEMPIIDAIHKMEEAKRGCILVGEDGKLHGLVSEKDVLVKYIGKGLPDSMPVRDIMSSRPERLSPDDTVGKVIEVMARGGYRHVPLTDSDGTIVGMVSARDIVSFIVEHFPAEVVNLPPTPDQKMVSPEGA